MKYEFDEVNHVHTLDGKPLTGCTTVIGVIAKPALISWAANMVANHIKEHAPRKPQKGTFGDYIVSEELLEEARKAHTRRKEKAGDWGKELHAEVEDYIKYWLEFNTGEDYKARKWSDKIKPFVQWVEDNKVRFIASEQHVYSEKMWTGGIVDIVCEIDGKRWIGDVKTSNSGVHPENFWQCAGYDLMLEEMGEPKADGYLILNLKENGEFNEKRSIDNMGNQDAFLCCLGIYRQLEKIKLNIK